MERRVNASLLLALVCMTVVFTVAIALFKHQEEQDFLQGMQTDIAQIQKGNTEQLKRLYLDDAVSDAEKNTMQMMNVYTQSGEMVTVYYPTRDWLYTFKNILPIAILVMGLFVLLIPKISHWFTTKTLQPILQSMEEIQGILAGKTGGHVEEIYPELEPLMKEIEYEKAQINYSMNKLIESEQMRRDFTANVSHELKTPLTSINGYAEMIASGISSEEDTQRFAEIILHEGNRLLSLIDDTIRLSLLEKEEANHLFDDIIDMHQLAEDVVEKHAISAKNRDVHLIVEGESAFVKGNRRMLEDVITNLMSNAIKYNKPGGDVRISTRNQDKQVIFTVKDTGIGIAEEDQPRVFERFYMGNKARVKKEGTGLGLSIVKHVVKLHHGEIHLQSDVGKGTTITIALQKAKP